VGFYSYIKNNYMSTYFLFLGLFLIFLNILGIKL